MPAKLFVLRVIWVCGSCLVARTVAFRTVTGPNAI
jgi:hypothetical protein